MAGTSLAAEVELRAPRPAVPLPLAGRLVARRARRRRRRPPPRSRRFDQVPARRGAASTNTAGGSGTSASARSSPGRWTVRSAVARPDAIAARPAGHRRRCARCTAGRRRYFDDPRLVQWAGRYATYSGSSPYRAPATLACIPHIERATAAGTRWAGSTRCARRCSGRRRRSGSRSARLSTSCASQRRRRGDRRRAGGRPIRAGAGRRRQRRRRAPLRRPARR